MTDVRNNLLTEDPWKLMFRLSLPAILGQFVVGLYAFVDSIYVGQMVGVSAMSAVSAASPFVLINNGIAVLVGIGSGSILARAVGAGDQATVDKIMGNLTVLVILLSGLVMAIGIPLAPVFLRLSGAEGEVLTMGVSYLRTVYLGSIFVNFMQSANMVMRAEGRMGTAMAIMAGGAVLNIILDPVFILLMPGRGPQAVALATILSQFCQAVFTLVYFIKKSPVVRFRKIRLEPSLLPGIFSVGVSAMLMQVLMLVQMTVVYNTAVRYGGPDQIALMGAAQRVLQLAFVPIWGMSQGLQPAAGTNYGAKQYRRVKTMTNVFIAGSTILALVFFGIMQLFPRGILSAFITDPSIVEQGLGNFRLMYSVFPTYGLLIMTMTFFQALGKGAKAGMVVMLRQIALIVPLVLILPRFLGITGVWLAIPANDAIVLVLALVLLAGEYRNLTKLEKGVMPLPSAA
ncbi:MATE family efflux transporter [Brucepastera parasyntrophica]|uniref:MATE family efflux transporter n=1 Tax=Brucepastera parasyntrophica TaxID=2880008 RepID=UPI00210D4F48|nr:MATE family efflux transporter [Brucepastera parasyntrophica]ULQ59449.1 MATE family efflux transporter [Brucepastera parasyntrophica]